MNDKFGRKEERREMKSQSTRKMGLGETTKVEREETDFCYFGWKMLH